MQKKHLIHGLTDLDINVKEMKKREYNKFFGLTHYYGFNRGSVLSFYLDKLPERLELLKNDILHIRTGFKEDLSSFCYQTIDDLISPLRISLTREIECFLSRDYKHYPFGYKFLYFFNDKGASKYPRQDEWNKAKQQLIDLKNAFATDESALQWLKENVKECDLNEYLDQLLKVSIPKLSRGDVLYAVYMPRLGEILNGQKMFYIDTYEVDYVTGSTQQNIKPEEQSYHASLSVRDKEDNHSSYKLSVYSCYENEKIHWFHENDNLILFTTKEDAERYIENFKNLQMAS